MASNNASKEDSEWVTLNVGGTLFMTTRTTLSKDANSMLGKMFGSNWNSDNWPRDTNGAYLIDSDPKYFGPVLNYLRRGELIIDGNVSATGILAEAKYLGIQGVVDLLEPPRNQCIDVDAWSWEDVGGLEGVKRELQQVVDSAVKYKEKFQKWGVGPSRNILLYGPPGCGKTLLARVTANQIKANFVWVKCPQLVADDRADACTVLENEFKKAKAMQPCIVFLEEFECIARVKGEGDTRSDNIISHLAILLDSITASWESVFVFATTNRADVIEPALLHPGRFDQLIYIPMPDTNAREEILRAALRKVPLQADIDLPYLATHTHGFSGADLKEICQRACKFAIRESIEKDTEMVVSRSHMEMAMSYSRRSVSDRDVYRYEYFNQVLQKISMRTFSFPDNE